MDFISNEFEVEQLTQIEGLTLYAGMDDLHYHLVLSSSSGNFDTLMQTHLHRYELANTVLDIQDSKTFGSSKTFSENYQAKVEKQGDSFDDFIKWRNCDEFLPFAYNENENQTILSEDILRLKSNLLTSLSMLPVTWIKCSLKKKEGDRIRFDNNEFVILKVVK